MQSDDLIYVAMPYSHSDPAITQDRMTLFAAMMGVWATRGETVVSPLWFHFALDHTPGLGNDWATWERYSKSLLGRCTKMRIIRVDGWISSSGVIGERKYAESLGIPVEYVDPY